MSIVVVRIFFPFSSSPPRGAKVRGRGGRWAADKRKIELYAAFPTPATGEVARDGNGNGGARCGSTTMMRMTRGQAETEKFCYLSYAVRSLIELIFFFSNQWFQMMSYNIFPVFLFKPSSSNHVSPPWLWLIYLYDLKTRLFFQNQGPRAM